MRGWTTTAGVPGRCNTWVTERACTRHRVAATASVYFRRFYLKNCFCHVDPRLVFVGCIYLASKVEESQLQAKHLVRVLGQSMAKINGTCLHVLGDLSSWEEPGLE